MAANEDRRVAPVARSGDPHAPNWVFEWFARHLNGSKNRFKVGLVQSTEFDVEEQKKTSIAPSIHQSYLAHGVSCKEVPCTIDEICMSSRRVEEYTISTLAPRAATLAGEQSIPTGFEG